MVAANSTKEYTLYPNESVDKLTVNRPLSNLHGLLEQLSEEERKITVTEATSTEYGLVKISNQSPESFIYYDSGAAEFNEQPLGITALSKFAFEQSNSTNFSKTLQVTSAQPNADTSLTIGLDEGGCQFLTMPNGIRMVILTTDVSLNDVPVMFGNGVYHGSIDSSRRIVGFPTTLVNDSSSQESIDSLKTADSLPITSLFDRSLEYDSMFNTWGSIHYNDCNYTAYSSFKQSYVEVSFTVYISVAELYERLYGYTSKVIYNESGTSTTEQSNTEFPRSKYVFSEKPVILSQLCMYNNDSRPSVLIGKTSDEGDSTFDNVDVLTEKPLSEVAIGLTTKGRPLNVSPVGGSVILKKYENAYMRKGKVKDNMLTLDISLKFFAGSADDPSMNGMIRGVNAKSQLQILLFGV